MKKVNFNLRLGIVGTKDSGKHILIEYLNQVALKSKKYENIEEFLVVQQDIPLKIKVFSANDFNQMIYNQQRIEMLDVIIIVINIYNTESFDEYNIDSFNEFSQHFMFQGISILVGIDSNLIEFGIPLNKLRISRFNLINKAKELNFLFCFEFQSKNRDLLEFYNKIFDLFIRKLQVSSPEMLERAKSYGKELINQFEL